ncbi:18S rRNA (guanine1575-N7)-methyltransferase [Thecaphora frezii]
MPPPHHHHRTTAHPHPNSSPKPSHPPTPRLHASYLYRTAPTHIHTHTHPYHTAPAHTQLLRTDNLPAMSRPEHLAPPEIFYGDDEAAKYTANTRVQTIQAEMTERALELLMLPEHRKPALLLDIGCGSGLSGEILTEHGHEWIGMDIAPSMLEVALERETEGDVMLADVGQGCGFRAGSFDGAISISVLQWLCNADSTSHSPAARLSTFFQTLYSSLSRGSRAVFQFYPESDEQVTFIMSFATKAGFGGGLVVDFPNSRKAKKFYLVLWVGGEMSVGPNGQMAKQELPQGLVHDHEGAAGAGQTIKYEARRKEKARKSKKKKSGETAKEYILRKKELNRLRGKEVSKERQSGFSVALGLVSVRECGGPADNLVCVLACWYHVCVFLVWFGLVRRCRCRATRSTRAASARADSEGAWVGIGTAVCVCGRGGVP